MGDSDRLSLDGLFSSVPLIALKRGTKWKGLPSHGARSGDELGEYIAASPYKSPKSRAFIGCFCFCLKKSSFWPNLALSLVINMFDHGENVVSLFVSVRHVRQ